MDIPEFALPADLLPGDGRFGSGPSKVRTDALAALADTGSDLLGTSHRRPMVKTLVGRLRSGLRTLFALPEGYEVVLGNGGATAFWDAAAYRLIEHRSQHLTFGEFSSKFAAVAAGAPFLQTPSIIDAPYGQCPRAVAEEGVDAYALTHNETSTGVAARVERPAANGLVLVDATSAAGGMPVDPAAFDVYYFSPQKAFGSEGGLWAALCSGPALDRITASQRWTPPSLDLKIALDNSRKDQTYNTPALATLFLFTNQVEWLLERGGLPWAVDRCRESSSAIYQWAEKASYASAFVRDPVLRSPTVATIDLDDTIDADSISAILRANGVVDTESYRKLGRNQLRIALFPNVEPDDVRLLTAAVDWIVAKLGMTMLAVGMTAVLAAALTVTPASQRSARAAFKLSASTGFIVIAVSAGAGDSGYGRWVLAALALGWIGDAALLSTRSTWFLAGLGAFLLAHLGYVAAMTTQSPSLIGGVIGLAIVVSITGAVMTWLIPHVPGPMRIPVVAYVVVITAMVAASAAAAAGLGRPEVLPAACAFTASDIFVARDRFVSPGPENARIGLPLYYLAQIVFALSV